jgi:hypothetical protein
VFFRPDWLSAFVARIRGRAHPILSVPQSAIPNRWSMLATGAVVVYVLAMVLIPLRSVGDANVLRTGEGYQFGWRVMLTEKAGSVDFIVTDPASGTTWLVDGPMGLTTRQEALMATDPQLIRQAAAMVEHDLRADGYDDMEIRAESYMSYNGRSHARFIDPTIDLTDPGETGSLVASSTSSK